MRKCFLKCCLVLSTVMVLPSAYAEKVFLSGVAQAQPAEEDNNYQVKKGVMTFKGYDMPRDVDLATFEPLAFPYSKDKKRLYCGYEAYDVTPDNLNNLKIFKNHFAVDNSHIYFCEADHGVIPYQKNYEMTECFGWVKADSQWFYRLDSRPEVKGSVRCLDNLIYAVIGKKLYSYGKEIKLPANTKVDKLISLGEAGNGHYFTDQTHIIYESAAQAINVPLAYSAAIQLQDNGNIITDGHQRYYCQQAPGHYGSEPKPFCELRQ